MLQVALNTTVGLCATLHKFFQTFIVKYIKLLSCYNITLHLPCEYAFDNCICSH